MAGLKQIILAGLTGVFMAAAGTGARSETPSASAITSRPVDAGDAASKLTTSDQLSLTNKDVSVPALAYPDADGKNDVQPSGGLKLLERMGAGLPDLPPEKKFTGKVDDAYGAYQRGLYLTALNFALPRAQRGDAAAQTLVGELLNNGFGVRRNPKDAAFWYEQAAKAGDANAQFKYAMMLIDGSIVARDKKLADEMMHKAAEGGNAEAQFNIAQLLVAASPGEKGLNEALSWYEKSAAQGIPDAEYALAQLYINLPVPKEKKDTARRWLLKAANAGFDTALYDMAVWYINGVGGDRDFDLGFGWMKRAANRGHVLAQNKLAHLYIAAIGTKSDTAEAAKWYILSRRAGLADLALEDFYLGISDDAQKEALHRANQFRVQYQ